MAAQKKYSFDVDLGAIGKEHVEGTLYIEDPPKTSYTEGKLSGTLSQDYKFDVPIVPEVCSPEYGVQPFVGKLCFKADFAGKKLQGCIKTKNFPSGDWSDCTWVDLGSW